MAISISPTETADKIYKILFRESVGADVKCIAGCNHYFQSGRALAVEGKNGERGFIGPTCAANHAFRINRHIIDLSVAIKPRGQDDHENSADEKRIVIARSTADGKEEGLTKRQEYILAHAYLRVCRMMELGMDTRPEHSLRELVRLWNEQESIPVGVWKNADKKVAEADATHGKKASDGQKESISTQDLFEAFEVQKWLLDMLKTKRLGNWQNYVQDIQEKQKKFRRITPPQYEKLEKASRFAGVVPLGINHDWFGKSRATFGASGSVLKNA